jgi:hypothetical protein
VERPPPKFHDDPDILRFHRTDLTAIERRPALAVTAGCPQGRARNA